MNFRVDETLKAKPYAALRDHRIAPTDFFTTMLEYLVNTGKLPVQKVVLSNDDAELLTYNT